MTLATAVPVQDNDDRPVLSSERAAVRNGRATIVIDLGAVAANYRDLVRVAGPKTTVGAVVKANAYGVGVAKVAPALYLAGARHFWVANVAEGVELHQILSQSFGQIATKNTSIYILHGLRDGAEAADIVAHGLIPVISDEEALARLALMAKRTPTPLPLVLGFETGLNRLGFEANPATLGWLANYPWAQHNLAPRMVMSHLACADDATHPLNQAQAALFAKIRAHFPTLSASLAASNGLFLGHAYRYDMVRVGRALYGFRTPQADQHDHHLGAAITNLTVPILQLRTMTQDGTVGYGATARVKAGQRLAIVEWGYSDGLFRHTGPNVSFFHQDQALPVVGRLSMDLTALDVSALPEDAVRQGDALTLIGPQQSIDDLAAACGTIGYEILTALSRRAQRFYIPAEEA
jgi:alanine racemase